MKRDAIAAGNGHTVGLKADGTVVFAGWTHYNQYDFSGWTNIVAISSRLGLKSDGTVVTADKTPDDADVSSWTDIKLPK